MPIKYGNFHVASRKSISDSGGYPFGIANGYPADFGEIIRPKDNSKLFKTTGIGEIQISVQRKVGGDEDSAQYAYEEYLYGYDISTNLGKRNLNRRTIELASPEFVDIKQKTTLAPQQFDTTWKFGNSIRIYSDGTTPDINYIDSNVFRGGADFGLMFEDSHWDDFGGILSNSTPSAPDSDLRNTAYSDSEFYDYYSIQSNLDRNISLEGGGGSFARTSYIKTATDLFTLEMEDSIPYNNRFIQGALEAAESDGAAAGGGGGGVVVAADPESWS